MIMAGNTLNHRYLLKKQIAEGGFAQVYLGADLLLGRQVAVKVLDQMMASDQDILMRFRREAQAVAMLEHPHILQVYDYGEVDRTPYLVMPYVSGGTLGGRMKEGPLTLDEIGVYIEQIGSALDYAHEHGIIHRDVKPNNLLIKSDGKLVLMDFGLAKVLERAAVVAETGVFGTVAYMAPEQFQGLVSPLSDIYMLGIMLYQMLAGKLPFEGNTGQVLLAHMQLEPSTLTAAPTVRSVHPAVIKALDQVVLKALAKQPSARFQTALALSNAYYIALKADPTRFQRDAQLNVREISGTIIDKKPVVPAIKDLSGTIVDKKPVMPAIKDVDATMIAPKSKAAAAPAELKLKKPARLLVTTEPEQGFEKTFELVGDHITLGRARDNQLWLPLEIISRYHAVIDLLPTKEPTYKIVQLKSANPMRFNDLEIEEKTLAQGDTLEVGKRGFARYVVKFTFQAPEYE
jgi:serine/threonine protein kinase